MSDRPVEEARINQKKQEVRDKLLAAGFLVKTHAPESVTELSPEALLKVGQLPAWARSSQELIDEDRGAY